MEETCALNLYSEDGVLFKSAPASHINDINLTGTLSIVEYANTNGKRCIEWKPSNITATSITVDSDEIQDQDQEWALVNTAIIRQQRERTLSGNTVLSDAAVNTKRVVCLNFRDIKFFRITRKYQQIGFTTLDKHVYVFFFQHGNADGFVASLKGLVPLIPTREKNTFYIDNEPVPLDQTVLDQSFAELNLFPDNSAFVTKFWKNLQNHPYETTLEAFSKLTDILYRGPEQRYEDAEITDLLNRSLTNIDETTITQTHGEYEVVAHVPKLPALPPRKAISRSCPLTPEQWAAHQDEDGRIVDVATLKEIIFRGGITPSLRFEVWKYLLNYYPWNATHDERTKLHKEKVEEYFTMKLQWRSMTPAQENNFSDYRERKSLIEKDVNRTDRTISFYAGENNPHLQLLSDILMTYVMYNFDLGYVQGMSDLLSPILCLVANEVDAFWCFVGFMDKVCRNFDMDQAGMKEQLEQLHTLLAFVDSELTMYLDKHDSGNMFFCFRWLLVLFKRELSQQDTMQLWEVLWTDLPCKNFHLLICLAILDTERDTLMNNNYGFTEILKHINDLSLHIELKWTLSKAEGIYQQIITASHLTNPVRAILGLELIPEEFTTSDILAPSTENDDIQSINDEEQRTSSVSPETISFQNETEVAYSKGLELSYI